MRVLTCTLQPPCDLRVQPSCDLHNLYTLYSGLHLSNAQLPAHTHTHNCEAWQRLRIRVIQTLEIIREISKRNHIKCMKRENLFFWEKHNPSSIFHLFHCIDWDFVNPFLTHNHRPCEWEKADRNLRSHIQIQSLLAVFPLVLQWRFFGKLDEEKTWWS